MKKKYYKVKSMHSSHKNEIGEYMGSFMENCEEYYTLRFDGRGFRSYPSRNLVEHYYNYFSTKEIIRMIDNAMNLYSPKKEKPKKKKDIKVKRFEYFTGDREYVLEREYSIYSPPFHHH